MVCRPIKGGGVIVMRIHSVAGLAALLFFLVGMVGVCLGAEKERASEPTYQGKTLDEWVARTKAKDKRIRQTAAWALGNIGPEARTTVPALIELFKDKEESVRGAAARALGGIGANAASAAPALTELLNDKNEEVQHAVAVALGNIGPEAKIAIPAITEWLAKYKNGSVPWTAAEALRRIGPAAIPTLTELLKEQGCRRSLVCCPSPGGDRSGGKAGNPLAQ